jgi:S1-C subfamily serine protease
VLAVVFGTGLFAGWQFGHGSTATVAPNSNSNSSGLQSGPNPQATVPALNGNNTQTVREAVVSKVSPSVVEINVTTSQGAALGSGVIIDQRGYIVTNNHVVNGASSIEVVLYDGTRATATLTGTDAADDLAVIKITPPAHMAVASLGDSSKLVVGQDVLAIGNPLGITQTVTNGIVSALNRRVSEGQGGATIPDAIQTDAPINPGNSGGALVDMQGNLIGIPTLTAIDPEFNAPATGVGFAIPVNRSSSSSHKSSRRAACSIPDAPFLM